MLGCCLVSFLERPDITHAHGSGENRKSPIVSESTDLPGCTRLSGRYRLKLKK